MSLKKYGLLTFLVLFLLAFCSPSWAIDADLLFPDTTKGFFVVQNAREFNEQWSQTQFGKLMQLPEMKEFNADLQRQLGSQFSSRFGFSLDDIRLVPSGEIAGGLIAPVGQVPGFVLVLDVTGRETEVKKLLANVEQIMTERKAVKKMVKVTGETATVYAITPTEPDAPVRFAGFLHAKNHLIAADQVYLVDLLFRRLNGELSSPIANDPGYIAVMQRCEKDRDGQEPEPLVRWFMHPLQYGESARSISNLTEKQRARPSLYSALAEVGFDAIAGLGGTITPISGSLEGVHRTFLYAPKPYTSSMKMFDFPNTEELSFPDWVPNDVASATCVSVNPKTLFDNIGPLFDEVVMQEKGVWDDIVRELKEDQDGYQIDLGQDLIGHFGSRIITARKYALPIGLDSENLMFGMELQKEGSQPVKEVLAKLLEGDPEFEAIEFGDYVLWKTKPLENAQRPEIQIGGGIPPLVPGQGAGIPPIGQRQVPQQGGLRPIPGTTRSTVPPLEAADAEKDAEPLFPDGAITIALGYLLFSNNIDFLKEVIGKAAEKKDSVGNTPDFQRLKSVAGQTAMGQKPHFLESYTRVVDSLRPTYELLRQGKMPQSKSILGRLLNLLLTPPDSEEDVRPAKIDGSKMPPYESIEQYLGLSIVLGTAEENGWFYKGFTTPK